MDPSGLPPLPSSPLELDWKHFTYLLTALVLGSLSAVAALMGSDQPLSRRVVMSYVFSGGAASSAVVLLLVDKYGFSYFLCGAGILAGYKAADILALLSVAITQAAQRFLNRKEPPLPPTP